MITRKSIEEVLQVSKIEEVVGDYVNLRRRGVNLIGLCPFHDEKTPSFTVSPAKNIFKCFGCSKGGDPVGFVMEHESLNYIEAIRYLAQKYNITLEETALTNQEKELRTAVDSMYIVNSFAKDHFVHNLWSREEGKHIGLSYFKERGFRDFIIEKFELGYAVDDRDDFLETATKKQLNIDLCKTMGLISASGHDFFRARVMFPIHGVSGKVVGFGGRTLSSDKKIPKYINSIESDIYNKRNVLYGLFFAKEPIRKHDECILVEGYTDVISLHQGEITNVVAASGTSLTHEQIKLIKRYTANIKIIFDGDPAGIKAALRGLDMVLEADMNVKLVLLPDKEDPDSFLSSNGTEKFLEYLKKNEEDFVFFKTRVLLEDTGNDPIKKAGALKSIVSSISKISDSIKRALYIRQCAIMLDINEGILVQETNKYIKESLHKKRLETGGHYSGEEFTNQEWIQDKNVPSLPQPDYNSESKDTIQEKAVAQILIRFGHHPYDDQMSMARFIINELEDIFIFLEDNLSIQIFEEVKKLIQEKGQVSHQDFIGHETDDIRQFAIDALSFPYEYASWENKGMLLQTQKMPEENYINESHNALLRLKLKKVNKNIETIEKEIKEWNDDQQDQSEYILQIKILQELLKERNIMAAELGTVIF
ncbi:MAG: DNA primase [Saprospiraceae bacterium]|nr:DNA primase [Saprospiraceae bacterium]MBK7522989.1 DNA primase [Saprospiraceae bacterium]MBK8546444.1 DNA primase [Saprospiraceae bacterium]MBK8817567.1 DNA primase [Saprospiraceae bacterium]MBK8854512.1 DNA primase [Saprospiraceae bacterium]